MNIQPLKIANTLRYTGAGLILIGIFMKLIPLWIVGFVVMLSGSVWRIIIKMRESKSAS